MMEIAILCGFVLICGLCAGWLICALEALPMMYRYRMRGIAMGIRMRRWARPDRKTGKFS